ncbi:MAG: type II toxin-antitoxin system prevent-host-death family antitoxin [Anaerolineae bacterium]|jgi:prevent-host-death family protein
MPKTIGVRELKNQTSRVLRTVREEMSEYIVTLRGEPVAVLRPLTEAEMERLRQVEIDNELAEIKALAQEVADAWTSEKSAVELVAEQRR